VPPSPSPLAGGFIGLLDANDREALLGLGRRRRYPRGAPIIIQGDHGDTVTSWTRAW
jgi:hypothetical protein